jgi:hypothetical protein
MSGIAPRSDKLCDVAMGTHKSAPGRYPRPPMYPMGLPGPQGPNPAAANMSAKTPLYCAAYE